MQHFSILGHFLAKGRVCVLISNLHADVRLVQVILSQKSFYMFDKRGCFLNIQINI